MNVNHILGTLGAVLVVLLLAGGLWGCPQYQVYQQRLTGEAELARADYNRQVAVREAQAKKDAASLLADAEIARAKGVAQANQIIGDSLRGNEAYLRYLWIDKMEGAKAQVIYVPTETGLPILEAGRKP
jgi:regulator of protease activity HflC (stomatin/prohibitin superfamily)